MELGAKPETLRVHLTTGSDFNTTLRLRGGDWPVGSSLSLLVGSATWTAAISGADATFSEESSVTDGVQDKAPAQLVYDDGAGFEQVWASGSVVRHG